MMKLLSCLVFFFTLAACAPISAVPDESLLNTYWRALEIDGKAVEVAGNRNEPHLVLSAENRAHGSDGCNRFNGTYDLSKGLRLGRMASTMMACMPPIDAQARAFSVALGATQSYRITGKLLELCDADGRVRLRLEATALK
jgi:heat shock protein HslJ